MSRRTATARRTAAPLVGGAVSAGAWLALFDWQPSAQTGLFFAWVAAGGLALGGLAG